MEGTNNNINEDKIKKVAEIFCTHQIPPTDDDNGIVIIPCRCTSENRPLSRFCYVARQAATKVVQFLDQNK